MNSMSLSKKSALVTILVTITMLVIGYFILNKYKNDLQSEVYSDTSVELNYLASEKLRSKLDVGISNAVSIANEGMRKNSLASNDRALAIKASESLIAFSSSIVLLIRNTRKAPRPMATSIKKMDKIRCIRGI